MNEVVVMLATGFEEIEALAVVDVLRRGNVQVTLMSIDARVVVGSRNISVISDTLFDETIIRNSKMIVLPGGVKGTENLMRCDKLVSLLKESAKTHDIAAICAAPSILSENGLLNGKRATSNPGYQSVLEKQDLEYVDTAVVIDGNFITSRSMATAIPFALELLERLKGVVVRKEVEAGMVMGSLVDYIKKVY